MVTNIFLIIIIIVVVIMLPLSCCKQGTHVILCHGVTSTVLCAKQVDIYKSVYASAILHKNWNIWFERFIYIYTRSLFLCVCMRVCVCMVHKRLNSTP